jgi:predicted dehydrogenase
MTTTRVGLVGRPAVVVVGTPPDSHLEYCLRALRAGADVICEKPLASSLAEADAILAAAAAAGRLVAVNHEFREMPIFRAVRDELRRGESGSLVFLQI